MKPKHHTQRIESHTNNERDKENIHLQAGDTEGDKR